MPRRFIPYEPHLIEKARRLRQNATVPERLLWSRLRRKQLGMKFLRQSPLGSYIVNFYAPELKLVVEVDGRSHDAARAEYDTKRQAWLEAQGMCVVRMTNDEVLRHLDDVVDDLATLAQEITQESD